MGDAAQVWTSGATPTGLMYRFMRFAGKGDVVHGHAHNYDHDTLVMQGTIRVHAILPDGREFLGDFVAPSKVMIKAGVNHDLKAMTDDALGVCVFIARDWRGEPTKDMTKMVPEASC